MIVTIENGTLIIDGKPRFCPYQPFIPFQAPAAGGLIGQAPELRFQMQPCGQWCAQFQPREANGQLQSVRLNCTGLQLPRNTERIDLPFNGKPETQE